MNVLRFAIWIENGISVLPVRVDGTKAPRGDLLPDGTWQPFQQRMATCEELYRWTRAGATPGVIGGQVSGGLEVIDFDESALFRPWRRQVANIVRGLPIVSTPGGYHVYYRCPAWSGNHKIARDRKRSTLIETRGEGGYVVAPWAPIATHVSGLPYRQVAGPLLPGVPVITPEQRCELWTAARKYDHRGQTLQDYKQKQIRKQQRQNCPPGDSDGTPRQEFNLNADWCGILEPHGWTTGDGVHWIRPGKTDGGFSATLRDTSDGQTQVLVSFTTTGVLAAEGTHTTYTKFAAWTLLNHGGDFTVAARELRQNGFGK